MLQILFAGDTAFGGNYQERAERKGGINVLKSKGYDFGFSNLEPLLQSSQFVLANLETTLTTAASSPLKGKKKFIHRDAPIESALALARHAIDAVSLGNNHAFDYGLRGLEETREVLEQCGIAVLGAGRNDAIARAPLRRLFETQAGVFRLVVTAGKHKWREYDYHYYADETSAGVNCWTEQSAGQQIRELRETDPDAFVVAFPHWGQNYRWKDRRQAALAHALVEAGADLVIGHGAHALQEIERLRGRWVLYGLGNFLFNSPGGYRGRKVLPYGLVAALRVVEPRHLSLRLYPVFSDNRVTGYEPRMVAEEELHLIRKSLVSRTADPALASLLEVREDDLGYCLELPVLTQD